VDALAAPDGSWKRSRGNTEVIGRGVNAVSTVGGASATAAAFTAPAAAVCTDARRPLGAGTPGAAAARTHTPTAARPLLGAVENVPTCRPSQRT